MSPILRPQKPQTPQKAEPADQPSNKTLFFAGLPDQEGVAAKPATPKPEVAQQKKPTDEETAPTEPVLVPVQRRRVAPSKMEESQDRKDIVERTIQDEIRRQEELAETMPRPIDGLEVAPAVKRVPSASSLSLETVVLPGSAQEKDLLSHMRKEITISIGKFAKNLHTEEGRDQLFNHLNRIKKNYIYTSMLQNQYIFIVLSHYENLLPELKDEEARKNFFNMVAQLFNQFGIRTEIPETTKGLSKKLKKGKKLDLSKSGIPTYEEIDKYYDELPSLDEIGFPNLTAYYNDRGLYEQVKEFENTLASELIDDLILGFKVLNDIRKQSEQAFETKIGYLAYIKNLEQKIVKLKKRSKEVQGNRLANAFRMSKVEKAEAKKYFETQRKVIDDLWEKAFIPMLIQYGKMTSVEGTL